MRQTAGKVLVVDAHPVIASSLAIALRHSGFADTTAIHPDELEVASEHQPAQLEVASEHQPAQLEARDIVLLGLLYGDGRTTLSLIEPLVRRGCRVVVMTVDQGLPLMGECLRMGAEAVLDKEMSFERLVASLRQLAAGGPGMIEEERLALLDLLEHHDAAADALARPFAALTDREAEVLAALVDGRSPKQIAHGNDISISTVRGHIRRVLLKLQVSSQREALAMARHAGWPQVPAMGRTD